MAACIFFWGVYRHTPGLSGWLLCTVSMQSNTFAFIYVITVTVIDWGYAFWKKSERPPLAPIVALITHIPSLIYLLYRLGATRFPVSQGEGFTILSIMERAFQFGATYDYIHSSFFFYFDGPKLLWILIALFSIISLFYKSTRFKRFWLGIIIGIIVNAHLLKVSGSYVVPRYLIMLLPLFSISPFLHKWRKKEVSIAVALLIVLSAHATPLSLDIKEIANKANRSYVSVPWKGLVTQLFSRTSHALIESEREDWKHLTLLLKAIVKKNDLVLFKDCGRCYSYPLMFYDRTFNETTRARLVGRGPKCSNWIVSNHPLPKSDICDLSLISRLNRLYVYGNPVLELQSPIYYSRNLE